MLVPVCASMYMKMKRANRNVTIATIIIIYYILRAGRFFMHAKLILLDIY